MAAPFSTSPSAIRTASRWSRPPPAAAMSAPRTRSISPTLGYVGDARRFDMGERDHFISLEMASIGMEMMAEWGAAAIAQRLAMLTERIAEGVRDIGIRVPERHVRAPHILSLAFKDGMPEGLVEGLASEGIYVAPRLGRMRVSPHVYQRRGRCRPFCRSANAAAARLTCQTHQLSNLMVKRRVSAVSNPCRPTGATHPSRRHCAAPQDEV